MGHGSAYRAVGARPDGNFNIRKLGEHSVAAKCPVGGDSHDGRKAPPAAPCLQWLLHSNKDDFGPVYPTQGTVTALLGTDYAKRLSMMP